jgi:hypothetical protein
MQHLSMLIKKYFPLLVLANLLCQLMLTLFSRTPFIGIDNMDSMFTNLAIADELDSKTTASEQQPITAPTMTATLTTSPTISAPSPEKSKIYSTFMDLLQAKMSQKLLDTATWMDSFFADPSYMKEKNHSYVKFRYDIFKEERTNITLTPAVDLRLALPQLEHKTHLVFSAEPAPPANNINAPVQTAEERFGQSEQRNLTTAIQYIFRTTPKENFFVRTGVQFSKLAPIILVEPRYRLLFPYTHMNIRFTQDVLWKSNTSWQTDTRFDFERLLPNSFFFRTSIDGIWAARVKGYVYSLAFSLLQPLAPTHAINYELINNFQTRPVGELTEIDIRIRYRHSFLRDWLYYEISPQLRFPRTENFRILPGILFRLEIFFGGRDTYGS